MYNLYNVYILYWIKSIMNSAGDNGNIYLSALMKTIYKMVFTGVEKLNMLPGGNL